jgi:hypothetical protein
MWVHRIREYLHVFFTFKFVGSITNCIHVSEVALSVNNQQNGVTVVVLTSPLSLLHVEEKLCAEIGILRAEGVRQGKNALRTLSTGSTSPQQTEYVQIYHTHTAV